MKKKCISFIFLIIFSFLILIHSINLNDSLIKPQDKRENYIKIKDNKYEINIKYPIYQYDSLNKKISNLIAEYQNDFKEELDLSTSNSYYTLSINYQEFRYKNYLSIIFLSQSYIGGAHPSHFIKTLNYNIYNDNFFTIDTLIEINFNILNDISTLSRKYLLKNKIFNDINIKNMMLQGTSPQKNNFENFVLTNKGIRIFFTRYQIAPYFFGDYNISIPYSKLNIII